MLDLELNSRNSKYDIKRDTNVCYKYNPKSSKKSKLFMTDSSNFSTPKSAIHLFARFSIVFSLFFIHIQNKSTNSIMAAILVMKYLLHISPALLFFFKNFNLIGNKTSMTSSKFPAFVLSYPAFILVLRKNILLLTTNSILFIFLMFITLYKRGILSAYCFFLSASDAAGAISSKSGLLNSAAK